MKELTAPVDFAAEEAAVVDHLSRTWGAFEHWPAVVSLVSQRARHLARFWFDQYELFHAAYDALVARKANLQAQGVDALDVNYDSTVHSLLQLSFKGSTLYEAVMRDWDFSRRAKHVVTLACAAYPDLRDVRPLGWDTTAGNGSSQADEAPDLRAAEALFQGSDTTGPSSGNIVWRTGLAMVRYEDEDQGAPPVLTLCGAILGHFLGLAQCANTAALADELKAAVAAAPGSFSLASQLNVSHPLLKLAVAHSRPAASAEDLQAAQAARAQLQAEQDAIQETDAVSRLAALNNPDREEIRMVKAIGEANARLAQDVATLLKDTETDAKAVTA